jgi:hypothetical protein
LNEFRHVPASRRDSSSCAVNESEECGFPRSGFWRTIGVLLGKCGRPGRWSRGGIDRLASSIGDAAALRLGAMRVMRTSGIYIARIRTEFEIDDVQTIQMAA